MFGIVHYEAFLLSSILLNITPGSDTIYILANSMNGRKAGILSALGISTGCLIHTLLAGLGLSVILSRSAIAFQTVKLIGASYLIYLGVRNFTAKESIFTAGEGQKADNMLKIYIRGILTNVFNPKVALFFLAFLPQFVDPSASFGAMSFLLLGISFVATSTVWVLLLAVFSAAASRFLTQKLGITSYLNKITGVIFAGLGVCILKSKA